MKGGVGVGKTEASERFVGAVEGFRRSGRRLATYKALLAAASLINLVLVIAGGMSIWAATIALGLLAAMLALGPDPREPTTDTDTAVPPPLANEPMPSVHEIEQRAPRPDRSWRALIDALHDPALALDEVGVVVHHNAAVADLFPRVRVGQSITTMSRSPDLLSAVEQARAASGPCLVELQDRVPVQRRVSAIVTALDFASEAEGNPVLLVTFRDITDQEKLAQMRADFIAHASHELRTPLASLRGFVETLQGPARDDAAARARFLGIMATQAARMTRLIDDLLSLSRIEMHVHVPPRGAVDLNEVVNFVAQSLEPVARTAGIALQVERLPGAARVRGDREELVQVVQNLVQNAIKYGREGGRALVRISRELPIQGRGPRLTLEVQDDGPGIPPEHLPRLTERFYRVSAIASREKGGTGLGLAIVKNVVTRHRGELSISSTVGKGSTFTVRIDELPPDAGQ